MKLKENLVFVIILPIAMGFPQEDMKTRYFKKAYVMSNKNSEENGRNGDMEKCEETMARNMLNFSTFRLGSGQGNNSLTLEEILQHNIDSYAQETNRISLANVTLNAYKTILFNAPLHGYDDDEEFQTMSLKVMAYIMVNEKPNFFEQQGMNTFENETIESQILEMYTAAVPMYKKLKDDPPNDPELCPCVNEVIGNDILEEMDRIANQIKFLAHQPRKRSAPVYRLPRCGSGGRCPLLSGEQLRSFTMLVYCKLSKLDMLVPGPLVCATPGQIGCLRPR